MTTPKGRRPPRQTAGRASRRAIALLAALALALGCPPLSAAEPFERLVPEGAVFYLSAGNVPALIRKIKENPQLKVFSEPQMQPLVEQFWAGFAEPKDEIARALGAEPKDLEPMLGGQACLAVLPRGDRDAQFLLLADVSGDPAQAESVVSSLLDYTREEGEYAVKEEEFRAYTVFRIDPLEEEAPSAPPGQDEWQQDWSEEWRPAERKENPGFISLADGILALASSPDRSLMEKHLVLRGGGDVPALGGSENYRRLERHMGAERDVTLFVDISQIVVDEDEDPGVRAALGTDTIGAFGMGLTLADDGTAAQGLLLAPAPRESIMRAFTPQGGSVLPPSFADEKVGAYGGLYFSLSIFWEALTAALQAESPEAHMMMQQQMMMLPVDVENNIINALGDRWYVYIPAAQDDMTLQVAVLAEVRNPAGVTAAIQQVLATAPPYLKVETVDFMGVKLFQFAVDMGWEEGAQQEEPSFGIAVMEDKVAYASDPDLLKSIIKNDRRDVSPLRGSAEFRQLLARTIEDPDHLLLLDGRVLGRWLARQFEEFMAEAEGPVDASAPPKMPPWEVLQKYETITLVTAKWVDDGLLVKAWAPHPQLEQ